MDGMYKYIRVALVTMAYSNLCMVYSLCNTYNYKRKENGEVFIHSFSFIIRYPEWESYKQRTNTIIPIKFFLHFFSKEKSE